MTRHVAVAGRLYVIPPNYSREPLAVRASTCHSCHEPIVWLVHRETGRRSPFDPAADEETPSVSHFATCPDAAAWRRR